MTELRGKQTNTQLSIAHLEHAGYLADRCEHYNPHARRSVDLFNFADIVAIRDDGIVAFVQTTSAANMAARMKKVAASPAALRAALRGEVLVHGWRKGKEGFWLVRVATLRYRPGSDIAWDIAVL